MKAILGEFWIGHKIVSFTKTKCGWWSRDHCGLNVSEMLKNCQAYFHFLLNILYLSVELLTFILGRYSNFRKYAHPLHLKEGIITEKVFPVFSESFFFELFYLSDTFIEYFVTTQTIALKHSRKS